MCLHKLRRKHNFPNFPSSSFNNSERSFSHVANPCVHYWPKGRDYEFSRHQFRRSTGIKLVLNTKYKQQFKNFFDVSLKTNKQKKTGDTAGV